MAIPDWRGKRVIVLGDLILDRFVYGEVHRISPEAPIPVVEVRDERAMPGGAANVASNVRALGGGAAVFGVVGDDESGDHLVSLLRSDGVEVSGLLRDPGRCTTVKTRIVAHRQQVVRVDREVRTAVSDGLRSALLARLEDLLPRSGALVVSDYAKGLFCPSFLNSLGELARRAGVPYLVDPKPIHFPYPGATVLTPNRQEAAELLGRPFTVDEIPKAAADLLGRTDWGAILFTLGPEGMALAERNRPLVQIPARVREVFDVTGAGDTVVAALALGLAAGLPLEGAARLANLAAGVVVGKVGTAVCSPAELEAALAAAPP
ncbi:MAG: D-glycero-beta-D-manno-heptose-7-phosphate kinase [Acidobacteriota bacterium]